MEALALIALLAALGVITIGRRRRKKRSLSEEEEEAEPEDVSLQERLSDLVWSGMFITSP